MEFIFTKPVEVCFEKTRLFTLSKEHAHITPWHFLYTLIKEKDAILTKIFKLNRATINVDLILKEIEKIPKVEKIDKIFVSKDMANILQRARQISMNYKESFINLDSIIMAFFVFPPFQQLFKSNGISELKMKAAIDIIRKSRLSENTAFETGYSMLNKYAKDLTVLSSQNKIDPVIGREDEIRRVIQILCRRTKNNPVLIGDPGVGKTAIGEGLASRIIRGDVPDILKHSKIYSLDIASLVSGTQFRGEFESRVKGLLSEIKSQKGKIILFIDELHSIVGAGRAEGSMDAANMLKPALAKGDIHCVGATTLDEYRNYIEKDAALERRFQPVYVNEPSVEDTISILRGLKDRYEVHHGVRIADSAIIAAAQLSNRYISGRFLPDKAIDLIDESASRMRMMSDSRPEDIDLLHRKIMQFKIEQKALEKEDDFDSKKRLDELNAQLDNLSKDLDKKSQKWDEVQVVLNKIRSTKSEIEKLRSELDILKREGKNLTRAGEILYSILPEKEKELEELTKDKPQKIDIVTEKDVAHVVSRWTGIPVEKMIKSEIKKLVSMEEILKKKIIGQDSAVSSVSNAIRRSRSGIQDPDKPLASLLFLGPTGVGKTELCKQLSEFIFDSKNNIVRLDMSEYMEKHTVSKLIGAPPGYVGYQEGGSLTEKVRKRPYCVVLFDEIEKAHPDVLNILLQILDDGILSDAQKHIVDFKNTIIVLTSNIGARYLLENTEEDLSDEVKKDVMGEVKSTFRPEFINRLDEIIIFNRLKKGDMKKIAQIELEKLKLRLESQNINIKNDENALNWLSKQGYDPIYGARPLKRLIQREIENPLAMKILEIDSSKNDHKFDISVKNNELTIN